MGKESLLPRDREAAVASGMRPVSQNSPLLLAGTRASGAEQGRGGH